MDVTSINARLFVHIIQESDNRYRQTGVCDDGDTAVRDFNYYILPEIYCNLTERFRRKTENNLGRRFFSIDSEQIRNLVRDDTEEGITRWIRDYAAKQNNNVPGAVFKRDVISSNRSEAAGESRKGYTGKNRTTSANGRITREDTIRILRDMLILESICSKVRYIKPFLDCRRESCFYFWGINDWKSTGNEMKERISQRHITFKFEYGKLYVLTENGEICTRPYSSVTDFVPCFSWSHIASRRLPDGWVAPLVGGAYRIPDALYEEGVYLDKKERPFWKINAAASGNSVRRAYSVYSANVCKMENEVDHDLELRGLGSLPEGMNIRVDEWNYAQVSNFPEFAKTADSLLDNLYHLNVLAEMYWHKTDVIYFLYNYMATSHSSLHQALQEMHYKNIENLLKRGLSYQEEILQCQQKTMEQVAYLQKQNEELMQEIGQIDDKIIETNEHVRSIYEDAQALKMMAMLKGCGII